MTVTTFSCSFSKKNGPIMPLDQNPHQTVTHFRCVGFSMNACGFSVPQMRQFCLFTYPPRSKWASSEKMIFFAKIGIIYNSIPGPLVQAHTQPHSLGGRIKLIICQIRHELSVAIHEISTIWKKNVRWRTQYMYARLFFCYEQISGIAQKSVFIIILR